MKRTEAEQDIEQIAGLIQAQLEIDPSLSFEQVRAWNRHGWTYEVRYDSQDYINDSDYTRVDGRVLSQYDLELAYIAAHQLAGLPLPAQTLARR